MVESRKQEVVSIQRDQIEGIVLLVDSRKELGVSLIRSGFKYLKFSDHRLLFFSIPSIEPVDGRLNRTAYKLISQSHFRPETCLFVQFFGYVVGFIYPPKK